MFHEAEYMRYVGAYLKHHRLLTEWTLQDVAERTGLSKSFLSMIENGSRAVQFYDLRRILACYGLSVGQCASSVFALRQADDATSPHKKSSSAKRPHVKSYREEDSPQRYTSIITPRQQALVLHEGKHRSSATLLLLRPLRFHGDAEYVELFLPAHSQFPEEEHQQSFTVAAEVRGVVQSGTLLIVIDGDEHLARAGEEFCFDGSHSFILRNYRVEPTTALLVITPPML